MHFTIESTSLNAKCYSDITNECIDSECTTHAWNTQREKKMQQEEKDRDR